MKQDAPSSILDLLLARWYWVVIGVALGSIIGFVSTMALEASYESAGKLLVVQKMAKFLEDAPSASYDARSFDEFFATHLQLVGSSKIVKKAVQEHHIDTFESIQKRLEPNQTTTEYIQEKLAVSRAGSGDSKGAFVIRLAFKHSDPDESKLIVDAIFEAYVQYIKTSMLDGQPEAVKLIGQINSDVAQDVQAKSKAYRDYLKDAPGQWTKESLANPHQVELTRLSSELSQLELKKVAVEARLKVLQQLDQKNHQLSDLDQLALIDPEHIGRLQLLLNVKKNEINRVSNSIYPERQEHANLKYRELLKLRREETTLLETLGSRHSKIIELRKDIEILEEELSEKQNAFELPVAQQEVQPEAMIAAYRVLLKNDLSNFKDRIQFVRDSINTAKEKSQELLAISLESERLQHEYERSRDLYQAMLDLLREQNLVNEFGGYVTEVIASPKIGKQVWPNKPVIVVLGSMVGMFLSVVLIVAGDWSNIQATLPFRFSSHRQSNSRGPFQLKLPGFFRQSLKQG